MIAAPRAATVASSPPAAWTAPSASTTSRPLTPIGAPLPGVPNHLVVPEFSPDGAYLFAFTNAGREYRWDVRPSTWERQACAIAGRALTRAEWHDALPGREYRPACVG